MTVSLKNNFLANARGFTFKDSPSASWAFNSNLNQLTATVLSSAAATSLAGGAAGTLAYQSATNVTAFLAAGTNGYLLTMSGGLPAWEAVPTWNQNTTGTAANVSPGITPTWTGPHTWSTSSTPAIQIDGPSGTSAALGYLSGRVGDQQWYLGAGIAAAGIFSLYNNTLGANVWQCANNGTTQFNYAVGVNGNAPPAQSTGWGTPTGGTVVNNFAAGATPSLLQLSEAVAQLITVLKQVGILGA